MSEVVEELVEEADPGHNPQVVSEVCDLEEPDHIPGEAKAELRRIERTPISREQRLAYLMNRSRYTREAIAERMGLTVEDVRRILGPELVRTLT
jgi:hypothetical protein